MHKVQVWVSYGSEPRELTFVKDFEFPFAPFYGLVITDETNEQEINIELTSVDNFQRAKIIYHTEEQFFEINLRLRWDDGVSEKYIDELVESYKKAGWAKRGNISLKELKEYHNSMREKKLWSK